MDRLSAKMLRQVGLLLCLVGVAFAKPVEEVIPPAAEQAKVLLKGLVRNRNLPKADGALLRIGVLYNSGAKAKSEATEIVAAFVGGPEAASKYSVQAELIAFHSMLGLLRELEQGQYNGVYIHSSMLAGLSTALQATRGKKVASLAGGRNLVERGVSLGAYYKNNEAKLALNLKTCKLEGLNFDPAIALIATIIK